MHHMIFIKGNLTSQVVSVLELPFCCSFLSICRRMQPVRTPNLEEKYGEREGERERARERESTFKVWSKGASEVPPGAHPPAPSKTW